MEHFSEIWRNITSWTTFYKINTPWWKCIFYNNVFVPSEPAHRNIRPWIGLHAAFKPNNTERAQHLVPGWSHYSCRHCVFNQTKNYLNCHGIVLHFSNFPICFQCFKIHIFLSGTPLVKFRKHFKHFRRITQMFSHSRWVKKLVIILSLPDTNDTRNCLHTHRQRSGKNQRKCNRGR